MGRDDYDKSAEMTRAFQRKPSRRTNTDTRCVQDRLDERRSGPATLTVIPPHVPDAAGGTVAKRRVAAYCRVSTTEEAQLGSFNMQVQHFTDRITSNPQYELVRIYQDEGISGTSMEKREGFRQMITDACRGEIDLILTKSISRFGRNIVDILTTLRTLSDLSPPVEVNIGRTSIPRLLTQTNGTEYRRCWVPVSAGVVWQTRQTSPGRW